MKFINALSVKQKLILLVAIPAFVLLFFAQSGIREGVASKAESSKIIILSTLSKHTSSMIHEMQKERGMSAGYLGSKGKKFATELPNQQNITNQKISSLKKYLETFAHQEFGEEFSNSLHGSVDQLDQLKNIRSSILSQNISLADGIGYYTNTNGSFLSLIDYLPKLTKNSTISNNAKAYSAFLLSKERAGIERAVLANVFAKNTFPPALYKKLLLLINAQDIYLDVYSSLATDEQIAFYKQTLNNPAVNETITLRKIALDNQSSGNFGIDAAHWFAVQTEKINLLKTIENRLISDLELQAQSFGAAASSQLIMASIPAIIVLALVFFAYLVAKSILTPISTMKKAMSSIIQTGDFSQRITINQEDEIADSSHSINDLLNLFENTISEVNQTVKQVADGNFDARVETILVGDLNEMKNGINETAISINTTINELINVMNALVVGNFNQRIKTELKGKFGELGNHVNQSVQGIANTMDALGEAMDALAQGDFKHRITSELNGDFAVFGQRVDNGLESVDMALSSINKVMESIATGSFDSRVDIELAGQLDEMKSSVNNSINILGQVFSDAGRVFGAVANGDLCEKIDHIHKGVFGQLAEDANATVDKLTDVVKNIQESSRGVNSGAQDIAQGNKNLSNRTEQQAMNLEETAASMDEITTTVSNTANNASEANDLVLKARKQAISGGNVVKQAVAAMDEINNSSNRIAEIIGVIDEIAFQTNLLALNASVEAARAGEQGRGFAVVASEVRNLAGRSATAAKEIKDLIEDSVQKVRGGSTLVGQSGKTLEEIVDSVQNVTDIVAEIATAASEQSLGVSEVHKSLEQLQTLTQQNTAMVEEAAAASEELGDQSRGLNQMIQFFNIEKNITAIGNARKSSFKEKPSVATNKAAGQDFNNNDSWEEF